MPLKLKNRRLLRAIAALLTILIMVVVFVLISKGSWTIYDYKVLDYFYRMAIHSGRGPMISDQIVYLVATDETYQRFAKNYLDRADIARVNQALAEMSPEAVAFDIIFAYSGQTQSDRSLQLSLTALPRVYLPVGVDISKQKEPLGWSGTRKYMGIESEIQPPAETGHGRPHTVKRIFPQNELFSKTNASPGHICATSDSDGIYRHQLLLIKINQGFLSSLSLSMYLDYHRVPISDLWIDWGEAMTIPLSEGERGKKDLSIPIEANGRVFIPYPESWGHDFPAMTMHGFLDAYGDENLRGNLLEFFESKFVFIGDVATGASDVGHTTLEPDVPLISQHAAMLNAMLTDGFYRRWTNMQSIWLVLAIGLFLGLSSAVRASWVLYIAETAVLAGLVLLTFTEITAFRLVPLASIAAGSLLLFIGLITGIEFITGKERRFIKKAFSQYVPKKVVDNLLANPAILKLGGEKREMTALFSDLEGFTSFSEKIPVEDLVQLLNQYLTAMTDIVLNHGGIIDKYEGDAIMAEFGAPIDQPDHADRAVLAALDMQQKLNEMRGTWAKQGWPELSCRIGINTGIMVIGNMGSDQVFDYTIIGDAVNLASRLEGANKLYGTKIMISEFTLSRLTPYKFKVRKLDRIRVKGKTEPVTVFEVVNRGESPDHLNTSYYGLYEEGLEAYLMRDFIRASDKFSQALELKSGDQAARLMIDRLNSLENKTLELGRDGAVTLKEK